MSIGLASAIFPIKGSMGDSDIIKIAQFSSTLSNLNNKFLTKFNVKINKTPFCTIHNNKSKIN